MYHAERIEQAMGRVSRALARLTIPGINAMPENKGALPWQHNSTNQRFHYFIAHYYLARKHAELNNAHNTGPRVKAR